MIVNKSIEDLMEELGGYVSLIEYVISNIGNWKEERTKSRELTGITDSTFDQISKKIMEQLCSSGVGLHNGYIVDVFEEALANSIGHGNNYDASVITSIKVIKCNYGFIIRVRDSGMGFNPTEIARKRKEGEDGSFRYMGEGFRLFKESGVPISFENGGTTINIALYKSPSG